MPIQVLMPALSPTMVDGKLAKWVKREGDAVASGDVIAEIETDKATMEVESVDEGTLGRILVAEGSEGVAVNTPIALLLSEGEDASALDSMETGPAQTETMAMSVTTPAPAPAPAQAMPASELPAEPEYRGPTAPMTVREALRDAMAEEMRRDPDVFVMGEEVAEYQGAYKITQGLLQEFGPQRVSTRPSPSTASPASASARR